MVRRYLSLARQRPGTDDLRFSYLACCWRENRDESTGAEKRSFVVQGLVQDQWARVTGKVLFPIHFCFICSWFYRSKQDGKRYFGATCGIISTESLRFSSCILRCSLFFYPIAISSMLLNRLVVIPGGRPSINTFVSSGP